jgi:hypothetical protein
MNGGDTHNASSAADVEMDTCPGPPAGPLKRDRDCGPSRGIATPPNC